MYNTSGEELINAYRELIIKNNRIISADELFNEIQKNKEDIPLESLTEAIMNGNRTEQHLNNLKMLNDSNHQTGNTLDTPLGNEENGIYVSHNEVITFSYNKNNEYVKEVHEKVNDGETNFDNISEEKIEEKEKIPLISFNEYKKLIFKVEELTLNEQNMIKVFENFLFDIIVYKDYLTPELYEIYLQFERFSRYIYEQESSEKIEGIKARYNDMVDRAENVKLTNVQEKVDYLKRVREKQDNNKGTISIGLFIIFIVILIGIIISIFFLK